MTNQCDTITINHPLHQNILIEVPEERVTTIHCGGIFGVVIVV